MYRTIVAPQPTDPRDAITSYEGCLARAQQMLAEATTPEDRHWAWFWIINAERGLVKWQRIAEQAPR